MNPQTKSIDQFQILRERMVQRLREHYKIQDEKILGVMNLIPRDVFVSDALKMQSYADHALPISGKQTISQPFIVARMTELLSIDSRSRVLEIGSGSGYQTAILAKLAMKVFAVERVAQLTSEAEKRLRELGIRNVSFRVADGTLGWEVYSPFDAIIVAAGGPAVPEPLLKQLKVGGKLVIPIGEDQKSQKLIRFTRTERGYDTEDFGSCSFVPLIGEHGWK